MKPRFNLPKEKDVSVPRDREIGFCMSRRQVRLKFEVAKPRSKRLEIKDKSRVILKAVVDIRTELDKVKTEDISGVKMFKVGFEAANSRVN